MRPVLFLSVLFVLISLPTIASASWGVGLNKNGWGPVRVIAVSPNSGFRDAAIYPGDQIEKINGIDVSDLSLAQVIEILKHAEPKREVKIRLSGSRLSDVTVFQGDGQDKHPPYFMLGDLLPMPGDRETKTRRLTESEVAVLKKSKYKDFASFGGHTPLPTRGRSILLPGVKGAVLFEFVDEELVIDFIFGPDECATVQSPEGLALLDKYADYQTAQGALAKVDFTFRRLAWQRVESIDDLALYSKLSDKDRQVISDAISKTIVKKVEPGKWQVVATILNGYRLIELTIDVTDAGQAEVTKERVRLSGLPAYDQWRAGAYLARGFRPLPTLTDSQEQAKQITTAKKNMQRNGVEGDTLALTTRHLLSPIPVVHRLAPDSPIQRLNPHGFASRVKLASPVTRAELLDKINRVDLDFAGFYEGPTPEAELRDEVVGDLKKAAIAVDAGSPVKLEVRVVASKGKISKPTRMRHRDHPDTDYFLIKVVGQISVPVVSPREGKWLRTDGVIASASIARVSAGGSDAELKKGMKGAVDILVSELFADAKNQSVEATDQAGWTQMIDGQKFTGLAENFSYLKVKGIDAFAGPKVVVLKTNRMNALEAFTISGSRAWDPVNVERQLKNQLSRTGARFNANNTHVLIASITGEAKSLSDGLQIASLLGRLDVVQTNAIVQVEGDLFRVPASIWSHDDLEGSLYQAGTWGDLNEDLNTVFKELLTELNDDRD